VYDVIVIFFTMNSHKRIPSRIPFYESVEMKVD